MIIREDLGQVALSPNPALHANTFNNVYFINLDFAKFQN
jgi:hypothetical protein